MFEIIFKIWYMIAILPILIITEGYDMLKKSLKKRGIELDWMYVLLAILIILLIVLFLMQYGYN